jgi:AraC-like DNA-binding protein
MTAADGTIEFVTLRRQGSVRFMISGPATRAHAVAYKQGTEAVVIRLEPGVHLPLLPAAQLVDTDNFLPSAGKSSFSFNGSDVQTPTFDNADDFVNKLVRAGIIQRDALVAAVLASHAPKTSVRTTQRRFMNVTGLSPHTALQIQRADRTEQLLAQGMPLADAVYEGGYFDQSHMTHSLSYFIGRTPAQIRQDPEGWQ